MDVGTAKPTAAEMLGVPHHMIDIAEPQEEYSVARYINDAAMCINGIKNRGRQPILVGGTGLYIDSLLSGRRFARRANEEQRRKLETRYDTQGGEAMLRELEKFDPQSALRLSANDKKRIVRAFEIYETTGQTITQHDEETKKLPPRYTATKYALTYADREVLYKQIERRVGAMIDSGLEAEVKALLDMGVSPGSTAMQAIGYKEMAGAIAGEYSPEEAKAMITLRTRRYAKRQLTWLRRDDSVRWITWDKAPDIQRAAREILLSR